ncbi:hypothetical protein QA634_00810 [Methylobacterium sp. CB376]|uniref:hypothetical protein n=1 Tax=unclassified Methylobacterium TaxID=2615210 RepID=UPI0012378BCD|nr:MULTISPECIES: hypothetical protein [Methylobacterium]WFT80494.1 hypothetical protein QA634_00810 [Methylobacterium nodulans]
MPVREDVETVDRRLAGPETRRVEGEDGSGAVEPLGEGAVGGGEAVAGVQADERRARPAAEQGRARPGPGLGLREGVLAARAAAPAGVVERLRRADPDLVEAVGGYFALPGSPLWDRLAAGRIRYCLLRARRRPGPAGRPEAGDAAHLRGRPRRMAGLLEQADAAVRAARA